MPSCFVGVDRVTVTPEHDSPRRTGAELTTRLARRHASFSSQPSSIRMGSSFLPFTPPWR